MTMTGDFYQESNDSKKEIEMTSKKLLGTALASLLALSPTLSAQETIKVGFVFVSPIGDAGWTYMHNRARRIVDEEFGNAVETSYVEKVEEGSDSQRVIRRLSSSGHDLIFTTSFGYMNPTLRVAEKFPDVIYEHATGYKTAENVGNYQARMYQGRYLAGMIAGAMSEADTLGYVAAFPIPEVLRGINAFTLGARVTNPDASVRVSWINAWHDPAKEREAADSLMRQGADVLTMHADSPAVVQAAADQGAYGIGFNSNMAKFAPEAHLTSVVNHWEHIYRDKVQAVLDGTWESESIWQGLAHDVVDLAPLHDDVPKDVASKMEKHKQELIDGNRRVFDGPVHNQAGDLMVPEGETLSDEKLLQLEWYVEGVQGKLPDQ